MYEQKKANKKHLKNAWHSWKVLQVRKKTPLKTYAWRKHKRVFIVQK